MKTFKALVALAAVSLALAGFVRAEDAKPEGKPAKCCANAAAEDKTCTHSCCVEAGEAGKNCEKCGGTNEKKG